MDHAIVSHDEWLAARRALLEKEKEFTRQAEELSRQCTACLGKPLQDYCSRDPRDGDLPIFSPAAVSSSFITSCSIPTTKLVVRTVRCAPTVLTASVVHLNHRDVTMVVVSRAPYIKLAEYQKRMGWSFNGCLL